MDPVTDLIITISNPAKTDEFKLKQICKKTMQAISLTNRVSLWTFNQSMSQIHCVMCLNYNDGSFATGAVLKQQDYPEYFEAIFSQQVLVASDARTHPATKCFNQSYFDPNDIHSLLDYVLIKGSKPIGIICCETVGKQNQWLDEDIKTLHRIANIISIFFETK